MTDPQAAQQLVFQLGTGYILSAALHAAASLGIADRLANGPRNISELAEKTGVNEDALYRVLRSLSSAGVFVESAPRQFSNNVASGQLRSGTTGLHEMVLWMSDPFHFQVYADIM